jgi:hypothetical protein
MSASVAGTGNAAKAGKELLHFIGIAIRTRNPIFRGSKYQFFKLRFALQTFVFKNRHGYLTSPFLIL